MATADKKIAAANSEQVNLNAGYATLKLVEAEQKRVNELATLTSAADLTSSSTITDLTTGVTQDPKFAYTYTFAAPTTASAAAAGANSGSVTIKVTDVTDTSIVGVTNTPTSITVKIPSP